MNYICLASATQPEQDTRWYDWWWYGSMSCSLMNLILVSLGGAGRGLCEVIGVSPS
uniref:Uncharacterized protein n=1 Tax=Anguilla anguilla TaxID=7936 RepID=A0A0E9SPU3_ANGAN